MKFFARSPPPLTKLEPEIQVDRLSRYVYVRFQEIAQLLNERVTPEDQFDAHEAEIEVGNGPVVVGHPLDRLPDRLEMVRADQPGLVYVIARTVDSVTVGATANGTYRVRVS